jgi:hypothetical protein
MGQHDLSYRLFFTHRRMIQDLLLKIVAEPWAEHIDFDSAELRWPTSSISRRAAIGRMFSRASIG